MIRNRLLISLFVVLLPIAASASDRVAYYINGIQNTADDSKATADQIQAILNASPNHVGVNKKAFLVKNVWNPIGFYGKADGQWDLAQDQQELFVLKTGEETYASELRSLACNFRAAECPANKAAADAVVSYVESLNASIDIWQSTSKISKLISVDMSGTYRAIKALAGGISSDKNAIIIAHSQGNLLANLALSIISSKYGEKARGMARLINVANTSDLAFSGLNFTHASDAALFYSAKAFGLQDQSLEKYPIRENLTRTTTKCNDTSCSFDMGMPTFKKITENIDYPDSKDGAADNTLNHSIALTYLNDTYHIDVESAYAAQVPFSPGASRFVDRFEDLVYVADASLVQVNCGSIASPSIVGQQGPIYSATIGQLARFTAISKAKPGYPYGDYRWATSDGGEGGGPTAEFSYKFISPGSVTVKVTPVLENGTICTLSASSSVVDVAKPGILWSRYINNTAWNYFQWSNTFQAADNFLSINGLVPVSSQAADSPDQFFLVKIQLPGSYQLSDLSYEYAARSAAGQAVLLFGFILNKPGIISYADFYGVNSAYYYKSNSTDVWSGRVKDGALLCTKNATSIPCRTSYIPIIAPSSITNLVDWMVFLQSNPIDIDYIKVWNKGTLIYYQNF